MLGAADQWHRQAALPARGGSAATAVVGRITCCGQTGRAGPGGPRPAGRGEAVAEADLCVHRAVDFRNGRGAIWQLAEHTVGDGEIRGLGNQRAQLHVDGLRPIDRPEKLARRRPAAGVVLEVLLPQHRSAASQLQGPDRRRALDPLGGPSVRASPQLSHIAAIPANRRCSSEHRPYHPVPIAAPLSLIMHSPDAKEILDWIHSTGVAYGTEGHTREPPPGAASSRPGCHTQCPCRAAPDITRCRSMNSYRPRPTEWPHPRRSRAAVWVR